MAAIPADAPELWQDRLQLVSTSLKGSPAFFRDKAGWFDVSVGQDGSADITVYASRSILNRRPGEQITGDKTFHVDDLSGFIFMLSQAYMQGTDAIDKDNEVWEKEKAAEQARLESVKDFDGTQAQQESKWTATEKALLEMGKAYGIGDWPLSTLHTKLGEALGIRQGFDEEGNPTAKPESVEDFTKRLKTRHERESEGQGAPEPVKPVSSKGGKHKAKSEPVEPVEEVETTTEPEPVEQVETAEPEPVEQVETTTEPEPVEQVEPVEQAE